MGKEYVDKYIKKDVAISNYIMEIGSVQEYLPIINKI